MRVSKSPAAFLTALFALILVIGATPARLVAADGADALEKALEKAASTQGEFKAKSESLKPGLKAAAKEAWEALLAKLKKAYEEYRDMLEPENQAKAASKIALLGMTAFDLGINELFGNCRIVPWQEIFDTAGSVTMDLDQKAEQAAAIAKMWKDMWENIFNEVMREHGRMESKGDTANMQVYMSQLEVMAHASQKAFSDGSYLKKYDNFKEALEKLKNMTPEQREKKTQADEAFQRAAHRLENKEFEPAKTIIESRAIPLYTELGDQRGLAKSYLLMARIFEEQGNYGDVGAWVEKARKTAAEAKDDALTLEIDEYWNTLKEKEKTGAVSLTENPFTKPGNLGEEIRIELKPVYGQARDPRPLPQSFNNHYFWRPVDLQWGPDDKGNPRNVKMLPFPGPAQFWLVWDQKSVVMGSDEKGTGGRPFSIGKFSPNKESVTVTVWDPVKEKNFPMKYEFLVIENAKVSVAGNERTFPPDATYLGLRLRSNTYRTGKIDGMNLTLCDDNTNATFNDQGTVEKGDHADDHKFWGCDTITVGSGASRTTTLFGSLMKVKDKYYFISAADRAGITMAVREYKGPMGKVQVNFSGGRGVNPTFLLIGTETGGGRIGFIDIGRQKGPVEVPAGAYFFKWGLLSTNPDPERGDRVEIYKGNYPTFKVEQGKTLEMELGGPFDVQIPVGEAGDDIELQTFDLKVFGKNGEEYRRFFNKPFLYDYKVIGENGQLVKAGKVRMFTEQDEMTPLGKGIGLLEFARHELFKKNPRASAPYKVAVRTSHPLLGNFETKGW